jgi:GNAT superfamily N-acetyltransferase
MTINSTKAEAIAVMRRTLAADFNVTEADLDSPAITITEAIDLPGRRAFIRPANPFNALTIGGGVVISTSPARMAAMREMMEGSTRDLVFKPQIVARLSMMLEADGQVLNGPIFGHLCSRDRFRPAEMPVGVELDLLERPEILALYGLSGFPNALSTDADSPRPDQLAVVARRDGEIVGIAAASADAPKLWQIGVDTIEGSRGRGVGQAIVSKLTEAILDLGIVPYYATNPTNIPSRTIAHNLGFWPAWTEMFAREAS